jgi:uncharacterized protein YjiS (DUF1127 family)
MAMNKIEIYPTYAADSVARAIASILLGIGSVLGDSLLIYSRYRRRLLERRELARLSDHLLHDIGLTRNDVVGDFAGNGGLWR